MGKRRSSFIASDHSGEDGKPTKVTKKVKKSAPPGSGGADVDSEGNAFWELSGKRRIVVQKFKGNVYVNIREYYDDKSSGEMKPGKKGIMLPVEQYLAMLESAPAVKQQLRKLGAKLEASAEDEAKDDEPAEKSKPSKKDKTTKKANIEATSDEADSD